jgi:hypothetical protein
MSKEGKEGNRVRESCVLNGIITELWALIRPFTFNFMPSVFQSVQAVSGALGDPGSVCVITYANGESERVRITSMHDATYTVKYDVLNAEERVLCQRSLLLLPVTEKRQVFVEFVSQYPGVIPLKEFIEEQLKKRTFFKALRIALSITDESAPWDCPQCTTQNPPTQQPFCLMCKKRNYSRGVKWITVRFDWMMIKDQFRTESTAFELAGSNWRILLFPQGLENDRGSVGVFLNALDVPEGQEIPCDFFIRVVHPPEVHGVKGADGDKSVIHQAEWTFSRREFDRGFSSVMKTAHVEHHYLSQDGLFTLQVGIAPKKRVHG